MNTSEQQTDQRILTMVSLDLWDPDGWHSRLREETAGTQKQAAEAALAPLVKVMQETGLFDAGFTIALAEQMPAVHWDGWHAEQVTSAVRDRLSQARDMIRDRVDLITLPEALVGYGHAVMPLLGDSDAGSVASTDGAGYELH
jgi:hypothetical protein